MTSKNVVFEKTPMWAWYALGALMLIYVSSFVDRQIVAVLAPNIKESLALTNTQNGILYGPAFSLVYAFLGIFMGRVADKYSRKYIILSGLIIWSLMTYASGFANSFSFLVTARIFVGVSQSALSPAVYSLLADYFSPDKRATVFSLYASSIFVGVGLSFLIGGGIAEVFDWRIALKTVGLSGFVLVISGIYFIKETPRKYNVKSEISESFLEVLTFILKKKTVWYYLAGFSLLSLNGYTILAFVSTIFVDVFGASGKVASYGWFMFLTGVGVNLSGFVADKLAIKWGDNKRFIMGIIAALGGLPFYYFGLFTESATVAFVLIGIANVIASSYNGVAAALIQYFVRDKMRGIAGALYLFVISIVGFGFGPPFTGWLIDNYFPGTYGPSKALFLVFTVCGFLATICFILAMKHYNADREE